jgi:hypothetical protein
MNDRDKAMDLAQSMRGQLILGQALSLAIKQLETIPVPRREISNIKDMRFLRDELFPMYEGLELWLKETKNDTE